VNAQNGIRKQGSVIQDVKDNNHLRPRRHSEKDRCFIKHANPVITKFVLNSI
jgi:hypothetical protein